MDIIKPLEIRPLTVSGWTACKILDVTPSQLERLAKRGLLETVWLDQSADTSGRERPRLRRFKVASIERLASGGRDAG